MRRAPLGIPVLRWGPIRLTHCGVSDSAVPSIRTLWPALLAGAAVAAGLLVLVRLSGPYVGGGAAKDEPYNLMVEGFRSGHTYLAKEAPPALASAPNPYLFTAYRPYLGPPWSLVDLSYYKGHLYAYFGATPAVILFWPYRALAGAPLPQARAVLVFCLLGYAFSLALGIAVWRRYFPGVGAWAGAVLALLLGSVTTLPVFVVRPGLYEVSISCAFALVMVALFALWRAWHREGRSGAWLAAASLAYGLAVGSRPSLLFGAAMLFIPAAASLWTSLRTGGPAPWRSELAAALLPISAVGLGLAAYNHARFDSALQFGHDYQLSGNNVYGTRSFAPGYLWDNIRLYFLEPIRWHAGFPFVWEPAMPALSPGHLPVEFFFGTLTNLPVLLAAALVPLSFGRSGGAPARSLGGVSLMLSVLFLIVASTICAYAGATSRYLLDFIPALALLAWVGFLGLESKAGRAGASPSGALTFLRGALLGALAYSVVVSWLLALALSGFYRGAENAVSLLNAGRVAEAVSAYGRVCRINPDFRGQAELAVGTALLGQGKALESEGYLRLAAAHEPSVAAASLNLGRAYLQLGRFAEATQSLGRAAKLDPWDWEAEADLGVALARLGRLREAADHLSAALRIDPGQEQVKANLHAIESVIGARGRP